LIDDIIDKQPSLDREFQFAERRVPTLDEINAASPDTPVFILHLYGRALLNRAAIKALGGGIAIQHRMAFQGEYFVERYGAEAARATPPVAKMLSMDVPVGAGTDATRVASNYPWAALY
jgi:predicted amidohydrolase YtcJ